MAENWVRPQPHENGLDPRGVLTALDPTALALKDPEALASARRAFIGVRPDESYELVRRTLGNPSRGNDEGRRLSENPLLPTIRCGHVGADGCRCGAAITVNLQKHGYSYSNATCPTGMGAHSAKFPGELEQYVIDAIAEALPKHALLEAISSVKLRVDGIRQRLAEVNRRLRRVEADLGEVSKAELEARREGLEDDKRHWVRLRVSLRQEEGLLQVECRTLAEREAALSAAGTSARLAEQVRDMAVDVPTLLRDSQSVPGLTASLIAALTKSISVVSLSSHILLMEIVFLDNATLRRLVVTGRFFSTQPQRAAAHAWRRSGVDADTIAKRMTASTPSVRSYRNWSGRQVDTLALLHAYFETVTPREGKHQSLKRLETQLEVEEGDLLAVVLTGVLGPLRIDEKGVWSLCPTEEEKERAFLEYARRRTASRTGWRLEDVITTSALSAAHTVTVDRVINLLANRPSAKAGDLVGRVYADLAQLPPQWRPSEEATSQLHAEARERYEAAIRATVLEAGFTEDMVNDFVPIKDLVQQLRTNTGRCAPGSIEYAIRRGSVKSVRYRGPGLRPGANRPRVLIHCPRAVRESHDRKVVLEWLGGEAARRASLERQMTERRARNAARDAKKTD